jgi:hypothetical protein
MPKTSEAIENRYKALLRKIFMDRYNEGETEVPFKRTDIEMAAEQLGIQRAKNIGDVIYSVRYRTPMPDEILATQPDGMEWVIEGMGRAQYAFKLVRINRIEPNSSLVKIKIPDATPEIITAYALSDEQALLAKVRYNRLVDIFLGISAYSLQNHLRTTVKSVGQIEIDEIYVGIDRQGRQYVMPVQAKGGKDKLSVVQTKQDILCCQAKFPNLICRSISTQFMEDGTIAMFELVLVDEQIQIVDERHYRLVQNDQISSDDLKAYSLRN